MLSLFLTVIFGVMIAYFSLQNPEPVTFRFLDLIFTNIPLYYVAVGFLLAGILLSLIIYYINELFMVLTIMGKDRAIRSTEAQVNKLQSRIDQLQAENEKLKHPDKTPSLTQSSVTKPNAFQRMRTKLSV